MSCISSPYHYNDVIMTTMASQITNLTIVYSTVYSDADQGKHQSSASLAFVWGIHRDRWIPRTKGQLRGKCFHLMTSSCIPTQRWAVNNTGRYNCSALLWTQSELFIALSNSRNYGSSQRLVCWPTHYVFRGKQLTWWALFIKFMRWMFCIHCVN